MLEDIIGYLGGFFITISFIPQVIKSYKTKRVEDISFLMILFSIIGTIFWLIYGLMKQSMPLILTNIIFGVIVLLQIYLKLRYVKK